MRTIHVFLGGLLLMGGLASCNPSSTDPYEAEASAFAENTADIQSYAVSKGLSVSTTANGLQYVITTPTATTATGKQPAFGDEIEFSFVQYILQKPGSSTLVTDKVVDSTYATQSAYYPFFNGAMLPGLQEGILLMREGQNAVLLMPARLAFGPQGSRNGTIPGNTPVRFDVRLKRSRNEDQQINDYIGANKLTVTETTTDGLRFIRTSAPTSTSYATNATLSLRYKGRLLRGVSAFDSTSGTSTRDFDLGQISLIKGFSSALAKMKVGETATVIFPSTLGYGTTGVANNGTYVIPPGAPLRFDVEVVAAK